MCAPKSFPWLTRLLLPATIPHPQPPRTDLSLPLSQRCPVFILLKMLMKKYALFVLVGGENIFHGVVGHKASWILCGEGRKYEPLKLFKWFPHCLGLGVRLCLFQHNQTEQGPKLYIDREVICEGSLGQHMVANWKRAWNYCSLSF